MRYFSLLTFVLFALSGYVAAEIPVLTEPLETLLLRASAATENDSWQKNGWTDEKFEESVSDFVDQWQNAFTEPLPDVPTRFSQVKATDSVREGSGVSYLDGELFAAKRGVISHARNSIILADRSVEISSAKNCLIVVRGVANVSHSDNNVIIAGHFIGVSHDGNHNPEEFEGSVLISGLVVDVSHSKGSKICAPLGAICGHTTEATFLNTLTKTIGHAQGTVSILDQSGLLPNTPNADPWAAGLNISDIVPPDDSGANGKVVINPSGQKTTLLLGDSIPKGPAEYENWSLELVNLGFALFSNGSEYRGVRLVDDFK